MKKLALLLLLATGINAMNQEPTAVITVKTLDITLPVGDTYTYTAPTTSGSTRHSYEWDRLNGNEYIKVEKKEIRAKKGLIGGSSKREFTFTARKPGQTTLALNGSWGSEKIARVFNFEILSAENA